MSGDRLDRAAALLGHDFADPARLAEALTHRSAATGRRKRGVGSNERLEFLGDRVLGLLIAEWLLERFPDEQEGQLGPRLAHLVSRDTLAAIGGEIGLGALLSLGAGDIGGGDNVLADALEAALGALFQDGGLAPARSFVRRAWAGAMDAHIDPPKDPKTTLQEFVLARGQPLPRYEVVQTDGPSHAPVFVMTVAGGGQTGTGRAGTKRTAEREAAVDLLAKLQ